MPQSICWAQFLMQFLRVVVDVNYGLDTTEVVWNTLANILLQVFAVRGRFRRCFGGKLTFYFKYCCVLPVFSTICRTVVNRSVFAPRILGFSVCITSWSFRCSVVAIISTILFLPILIDVYIFPARLRLLPDSLFLYRAFYDAVGDNHHFAFTHDGAPTIQFWTIACTSANSVHIALALTLPCWLWTACFTCSLGNLVTRLIC